MLGAVIIAIVILIVIPVGVLVSGAVASGLLGWSLRDDADARNQGSELVDLNG